MAHVEGGFVQVNERLAGMERRLDAHERSIALRFDQVDRRFNWLTGIVLSSWLTTFLAVILHH